MFEQLMQQLKKRSNYEQQSAVNALVKMGDSITGDLLKELLICEEHCVGNVSYVLARIGNESSFIPIMEALRSSIASGGYNDKPTASQAKSIKAISFFGNNALENLMKLLSSNYYINKEICSEMMSICNKNYIDVDDVIKDNNINEMPIEALKALTEIGSRSAIDKIKHILRAHPDDIMRAEAAKTLSDLCSGAGSMHIMGLFREMGVSHALTHALKDEPIVQKYAAEAVGKLGDRIAIKPLISILQTNTNICGHLQTAWENAAISLGQLGATEAAPIIIDLLEKRGDIRLPFYEAPARSFIEALGLIGDRRAVKPLMTIAKNSNESVKLRCWACDSLGILKDQRALSVLHKLMCKANSEIKCWAVDAIAEIGDPYSVVVLREAFRAEENNDVIKHIISALGEIGNKTDVPLLVAIAIDESQPGEVQRAATVSILKLGELAASYIVDKAREEDNWYKKDFYIHMINEIGVSAINLILSDLESSDKDIKLNAIKLLKKVPSPSALNPLLNTIGYHYLDDSDIVQEGKDAIEQIVCSNLSSLGRDFHFDRDIAKSILKEVYRSISIE